MFGNNHQTSSNRNLRIDEQITHSNRLSVAASIATSYASKIVEKILFY